MARYIYKYELESLSTTLNLPLGSKVLSVKNQRNRVVLYVEVDGDSEESMLLEKRTFIGVLTGGVVPNIQLQFIDTVLLHNDSFVLHVYEAI